MLARSQPRTTPSIQEIHELFKRFVEEQDIRDVLQQSGKRFYERLYSPLVILWCLVFQRLNAGHSCDEVVAHVNSGAVDHLNRHRRIPLSQRVKSESTAAFCKARQRLPLAVAQSVARRLGQVGDEIADQGLWLGHHVALLDGSTIRLNPQTELVEKYGQSVNQHGKAYWVVMRIVAAFSLQTGALRDLQEGSMHDSEQSLSTGVLKKLPVGTVCVADRNFGVFSVAQAARHCELMVLFRLTASRARALSRRSACDGKSTKIAWHPSNYDHLDETMSSSPIGGRLLSLTVQRDGFRSVHLDLFTTLMDEQRYTEEELVNLYGRRWDVELDLRYVKDTLDMATLAGKSLDIVHKELWAGLAGYNLIRLVMLLASQKAGLTPADLSFTKCWRRILQASFFLDRTGQSIALEDLLCQLARCRAQKRERFRIEPRAVRRRPAVYPALKGSRDEARQLASQRIVCPKVA